MEPTTHEKKPIALLHGAGYAGGELIRLLAGHPVFELTAVTSRTFAGQPVTVAHPHLRGVTALAFSAPESLDPNAFEAILIAAEHGQGCVAVQGLWDQGYTGRIVDLSADFRYADAQQYATWFGYDHPMPERLSDFVYGLVEARSPYPNGTRYIANPGCFASGLALALYPLAQHLDTYHAHVTALTGASGSGTRAKATTHYPTRDGNVRAYKVMRHQHLPEVLAVLGPHVDVSFVPVSGPWTRGIWGTAHVTLPETISAEDIGRWYQGAYAGRLGIRLSPGELPELRHAVHSPFCDVGWVVEGRQLVVGFALDNLLKGAASQAIQNLNLLFHQPDMLGLLPHITPVDHPSFA